ncbi:uncharacterized protein LOC123443669 [Hordeum vulgare subsp. vulgare]|uniref:Predicted protein n=1 Tax=Hordeum vulgare subsp. vulgare TaxID=112509 RepID=F2D8X3_HORVV|nr:uncharacterized protein LOC123443669 [Hordeum vulgare subsp. vulgare]BAJ91544.1 predicted protein [Hordeum vulgare subsp. vulgare]
MADGRQASRRRRSSLRHELRGERLQAALEECFLTASVATGRRFRRAARLRAGSRTAEYACHTASRLKGAPPRLALEATDASPEGVSRRRLRCQERRRR